MFLFLDLVKVGTTGGISQPEMLVIIETTASRATSARLGNLTVVGRTGTTGHQKRCGQNGLAISHRPIDARPNQASVMLPRGMLHVTLGGHPTVTGQTVRSPRRADMIMVHPLTVTTVPYGRGLLTAQAGQTLGHPESPVLPHPRKLLHRMLRKDRQLTLSERGLLKGTGRISSTPLGLL